MTDKSTRVLGIKKITLYKRTGAVLYITYIIILLTHTGNIHNILRTAWRTTWLIVDKGLYEWVEWVGGFGHVGEIKVWITT